jgi:lysophospholipase L1-like esterase
MFARCTVLMLLWIPTPVHAIRVATVGDSFADSLYNAMRSRPDLMQSYDVQLVRWSRPIVGLTRTDYFDYLGFLRDSAELGNVDVCFAQIGSNDMQSIPAGPKEWIAYGSPQWRDAYAVRTREMARILTERHCGQLVWVLQPGFEKRDGMACHRELINEVQREAARVDRTRVLQIETTGDAYGPDKTHFSRAYALLLGPALFHQVDTARQIIDMRCLACHRTVEGLAFDSGMAPLHAWRNGAAGAVWAPERTGVQCSVAAPKRVAVKRVRRVVRRRRAG